MQNPFPYFIAFFCNLLLWQYKFYAQHKNIWNQIEKSPYGTAYCDIIEPSSARLTTLGMATKRQWSTPSIYRFLNDRDFNKTKQVSVVPTVLCDLDSAKLIKIDGSANIMCYNGILLATSDDMASDVSADYAGYNFQLSNDTLTQYVACFRIKFIDRQNNLRIYIQPYTSTHTSQIKRIDSTH